MTEKVSCFGQEERNMPLDAQSVPLTLDWSAKPTVPAKLTLHAHTQQFAAAWRDGLVVSYDPSTAGRHGGMVAWGEMLRTFAKAELKMWGANMLDFIQRDETLLEGLTLPVGRRLIFIGTVYLQTGYSVGRQKYVNRPRQVFRALEKTAADGCREILVARSGYWVRGRDTIATI